METRRREAGGKSTSSGCPLSEPLQILAGIPPPLGRPPSERPPPQEDPCGKTLQEHSLRNTPPWEDLARRPHGNTPLRRPPQDPLGTPPPREHPRGKTSFVVVSTDSAAIALLLPFTF